MDINYRDFKVLKRGETGWVYIYVLKDPITNEIRYVGKSKDVILRLKEHIRESRSGKTHKNNWIKSLLRNGCEPKLEIIDLVSEDVWGVKEQYWIDVFKNKGIKLTNIANGGVGGDMGPESREKIRKSRLGVKASIETRELMSKQRMGNKHALGLVHTEETKNILREKNSGINNGMYGKHHKPESINAMKIKLSELNSGKNNPFYGKTHSEAFKAKKRKKVMQLSLDGDLIKIWDSITEAANQLDILQSGISSVCDKENKTYYNYKWQKVK